MYVEIRPRDGDGPAGTLTRPGETAPRAALPRASAPASDGGATARDVARDEGGTRFRLLARSIAVASRR